jgi:hypothetical protein
VSTSVWPFEQAGGGQSRTAHHHLQVTSITSGLAVQPTQHLQDEKNDTSNASDTIDYPSKRPVSQKKKKGKKEEEKKHSPEANRSRSERSVNLA